VIGREKGKVDLKKKKGDLQLNPRGVSQGKNLAFNKGWEKTERSLRETEGPEGRKWYLYFLGGGKKGKKKKILYDESARRGGRDGRGFNTEIKKKGRRPLREGQSKGAPLSKKV